MNSLDAHEKAAATYSHDDAVEDIARKLHEGSVFAGTTAWDAVDPIMRERRLAQAYDLKTLGHVQPINQFYASDHVQFSEERQHDAEAAQRLANGWD